MQYDRTDEPHYVYYIPKAKYIGRTLKWRQVKMLASGPLYDDGLRVRKQEHITAGRITARNKLIKLVEVKNYERAHMLEQLLIADLYGGLSNGNVPLGDETYRMYKSRIARLTSINYKDILAKILK